MATSNLKRTVDGREGPRGLSGFVKANGVARVFDDGAESGLVPASWNELRELAATGDQMMVVSMMNRPMVQAFMLQLEREKYPPGTSSNRNYRFYLGWWEDNMWACILVPIADRTQVADFADQFGLRLKKGIPAIISRRGKSRFPTGDHPSVWTLENVH